MNMLMNLQQAVRHRHVTRHKVMLTMPFKGQTGIKLQQQ
jgi:hypothetical protein